MTLKESISRLLAAYGREHVTEEHQKDAQLVINEFITRAVKELEEAGFEPGGKAVKAIEGMKDE